MKLQYISFYISKSQSKQLQFVDTYLVFPEVSSGRNWRPAEHGRRVVLGFLGVAGAWEKRMGPLLLSFNFLCPSPL